MFLSALLNPTRVFHDVMCAAGLRVIEEGDERKLESPQTRPRLLRVSLRTGGTGETNERGPRTAAPHVPAGDKMTDSKHKPTIRFSLTWRPPPHLLREHSIVFKPFDQLIKLVECRHFTTKA